MIHFLDLLSYNYLVQIKCERKHNHQIHQKAVKKKQSTFMPC
ncbi:hypothetical protein LDG_7920 [Legionella drancourtii LLAP12]|uniref:Uncharacterized protein n=1 Tax=Legionella drancourtii LLAP12 TaxID=658187 RepID=G9ERK5_9GAMM|nr:hypothetical protein LDG_7920 [Legionella drancourtii LLAP12]